MNQEERREFVRQHRTAVYGFGRQRHGPAMSIVYYLMDGDDILVWTMAERGKAKAVARNPHASLCVLDEKWPTTYVVVYGHVTLEDDPAAAVDLGMRVMALMAGQDIDESKRAAVEKMCADEHRVTLRLKPYMTFETPPRHIYRPDDIDDLTHWTGQTLPW